MKIFRQGIPFALSVLTAGVTQLAWAAPTSGAYVTDKQNTWVQDRVGDRIGTVNMIMCIIGSMKGDAMVNQGAYIALIDQGKCEGRGDSSKSTSTNAGASNATNYMSAVVQATQASTSAPLIMKAWMHDEEDGNKMTIYAYIVATAGKSDTNPNGLFSMYFCGLPDGGGSTCMFSGSLKSDSSGLSFYQAESGGGGGGGPSTTRLKLQTSPSTDSGLGRVSGTDSGSAYAYDFAYDTNYFHRDDGTTDACFYRDKTLGDYSTWRYGTYNGDGSRLSSTNPGFPVKYVHGSDTYFGFWSFWGLWLPESAMTGIAANQGTLTRHVGSSDVPLTVVQKPGKLWKLTRHASTLDEFKNVSMMFWSQQAVGGLQAGHNYEIKWNGSVLQAVGEQVCDNQGCSPQALSGGAITISASTLTSSHVKALSVFFPSGGSNGMINVPNTGSFSGSDAVYYRSREVVSPSSATINLDCVTQCPKSGSDLTSAFASSPIDPFNGTWGPSASLAASYTFTAGALTHDNNSNAAVDASALDKTTMGNYQWGLTSGSMIEHSDLSSIQCDSDGTANTSGAYYCPALIDKASVSYQWETGPNQWNKYFGASGITIDPPKSLTFLADASPANIRSADNSKYDGNAVQLQFSGFGELQGIPGGCVNPDTNAAVSCSQNTRWVPAFDILDGSVVSDDSTNYYVKFLERELRLGKMSSCSAAPSLTAASALTLPTAALVDVNARTTLGTEPTPTSNKPAVIDGLVQ